MRRKKRTKIRLQIQLKKTDCEWGRKGERGCDWARRGSGRRKAKKI